MAEAVEQLQAQGAAAAEDFDMFDTDTFITSSALNGRKGVIVEAEFIRTNYGKQDTPESTVARIVVVSPDLDKPRTLLVSSGDLYPSNTPGGHGPRTLTGAFLTGGKINKGSNLADFVNGTRGSGFPMQELSARGLEALIGAAFMWRAFEKVINKKTKGYDVPLEFVGYEDISALKEKLKTQPATGFGSQVVTGPTQGGASALSAEEREKASQALKENVGHAVVEALQAHGGNIPRSQLSIRVGPRLQGLQNKAEAFALLISDQFLAGIPGVTFDKKSISLAADAAQLESASNPSN